MPQKGESASFFSLHFYCNIQAGLPLTPPPSFLPLAGPLPHCYAGRVGLEKFPRRSPNFLLPVKARVGGRQPASGSGAGLAAAGRLNPSASASASASAG